MTTYLDLTAEQARELRTTGRVEVWRRMEPQPRKYEPHGGGWGLVWGDGPDAKIGGGSDWLAKYAPHPPGARARVREPFWCDIETGRWRYTDGAPLTRRVNRAMNRAWPNTRVVGGLLRAENMDPRASRLDATLATVRPEQRDGAWGWSEVWETKGATQ